MLGSFITPYGILLIINWGILITIIAKCFRGDIDAHIKKLYISSVQSLSRVRLFTTPWITARQASLSVSNSRSLLRLMSIESVMPSSHLILCHPLLLLPPIPPSIRVFSNEVAKVLESQLQHQSFQWSPRTDPLQGGLAGSPRSPRGSPESQRSINNPFMGISYSFSARS